MKKIIVISVIIIFLGLAGYVFVVQKSLKRESVESAPQTSVEALPQPFSTPAATIDVNDNLDQALEDLDMLD